MTYFKLIFVSILILFAAATEAQVPTRAIANPQLSMVGPRVLSLGQTNPVLPGDTNAIFINPASIGYLDTMPFVASNQKIIGQFETQMAHLTFPSEIPIPLEDRMITQKVAFGLSYGSNTLGNIPGTIFEDSVVRQVSSFSSGFNVYQLTAGTEFNDMFGFNTISTGLGLKSVRHFVANQSRSAFGIDIGAIASYHIGFSYLDQIQIGASVLNFLSTALVWSDTGDESFLPFQMYFGVRADLFEETMSLFLNNTQTGFSIASEYLLQENLSIRGALDGRIMNIGTGLKIENIVGIGAGQYSVRFDFNYTQNRPPLTSNPTFAFGFSILGESRPKTPRILIPDRNDTIQKNTIDLSGTGPKNTTIRIYNNDSLSRTIGTNRYGKWYMKNFPLKEDKNKIHITAYSIDHDDSIKSDPVVITSDTEAPELTVSVYPEGPELVVQVKSEEVVKDIQSKIDGKSLVFKKDGDLGWVAKIALPETFKNDTPVPDTMSQIQVAAKDEAGNETPKQDIPFFISLDFPKDKTVHYKEDIRFIGKSSPLVKGLFLNGEPAIVDDELNFALSSQLKPGKNMVKVTIATAKKKKIVHKLRVLSLKTFPDLVDDTGFSQVKERREIEFLSTLGILDGDDDGLFYPDRGVTRRYLTRTMVNILELKPEKVEYDLFSDVLQDDPDADYIQTAISNGLIFAFADGSFKPDQPLTLSETVFLLNNAGIVEEDPPLDLKNFITRKDLAQYLAYIPKYELKIERLIDWERGYE